MPPRAQAMKFDESVRDAGSLLQAHALGCIDVVAAVKLSKFGGLGAARRARDLCQYLKIMMVIEDTWGSDITTETWPIWRVPRRNVTFSAPVTCRATLPRISQGTARWGKTPACAPFELPGPGVTLDESILGEPIAVYE